MMGLYDNFPYTNTHELNTDWIVKKIKDIDDSVEAAASSETNAKASEEAAAASQSSASASALSAQANANLIQSSAEQIALNTERIDTILVEGTPTEGNAELIDIRSGADGVSYTTAGNAVRGQFELNNTLLKNSAKFNAIDLGRFNSTTRLKTRTSAGITYTWNDDFTECDAVGTSTGQSTYVFWSDRESLPPGLEIGKSYLLKYSTTDSGMTYQIVFYDGDTTVSTNKYTNDAVITVPQCTGCIIRLQTTSGNTINAHISKAALMSTASNSDLKAGSVYADSAASAINTGISAVLKNAGTIRTGGVLDPADYPASNGYSDLILCKPGDVLDYKLRGYTSRLLLAFYDEAGNFINSDYVTGQAAYMEGSATAPAGAYYFRVSNITTESYYPNCYIHYRALPALITEIMASLSDTGGSYGLMSKLFYKPSPKFAMHRGAQTLAPENTVPAFTIAGQRGAFAIETDVMESTDGVFYCFHDDTVDRMTDGTGTIYEMTSTEIDTLTIDAGAHIEDYPNLKIPTLEEYLKICRRYGCTPLIEIKHVSDWNAFIDKVVSYGFEESAIILGNVTQAGRVRGINKNIMFLGLVSTNSDITAALATIKQHKNVGLDVEYNNAGLTEQFILEAHSENVPVCMYTINNSQTAEEWFNKCIDMITSNSVFNL